MGVNKIVYDGDTLIDLTADTVAEEVLLSGYTAHNAAGESIVGTAAAGSAKNVWYGTCNTSANTAAKVVVCEGFELATGTTIKVKFTYQNTTSSATLNVNNTGAKAISFSGTTTDAYWWRAGQIVEFVYNGTEYEAMLPGVASLTYYGVTKLLNSTSSTSTTQAATANSVKQAYDLANSKAQKATYTATLSATAWSGTSAPYTQSVSISGILATDNPHITPAYSTTIATAIAEKAAWNCVSKAVTTAGVITFTCFEEMPSVSLSLDIEVVR